MALDRYKAIHAVVAVLDDRLIIQCPCHSGEWGTFDMTHQGDWLIGANYLLTEGRQDLRRAI